MRVISLSTDAAAPITRFSSVAASALQVADGDGEAHVAVIRFEPGGVIGPHTAGFGQLFVPLEGSGWIAGGDGEPAAIAPGTAGYVERGEIHSKGSDTGMTALMIQVRDLDTRTIAP